MTWSSLVFGPALACAVLLAVSCEAAADQPVRLGKSGAIEVAGRQVHCSNVRMHLDTRLPNLGAAAPDDRVMILNPRLLGQYSKTVQLFVFHHECGHHRVGASELRADCWAVGRGVRDGWLNRNGLAQVCRSFGNVPETDTHPSGRRRCANIDRCYATAELEVARDRKEGERRAEAAAMRRAPKLVAGPRLVRSSVLR
ncbi:MAG: hypothetical protein R3D44_10165 [Hyphomicrobiaceae bacterium]